MQHASPQFFDIGNGAEERRLATLVEPGRGPGLVWLPGLKSEMTSTKATALTEFARARGLASTRFDYSGHGQSAGRFEDGTVGQWLADAEAVFRSLTTGPQILVGSSMGGYIALLLLKRLLAAAPAEAARITALVLIAPAWDMTEELMWNAFPPSVKATIERDGVWQRPSEYGPPYPLTKRLIEEGRDHLLARHTFKPGCPVHIIHGLVDPDVPWEHTMDLMSFLDGPDIEVTAVPEGDHRLSTPDDIRLILGIVDAEVRRATRT
jgi:pimeloyl-ACP methyl ester carboxylesterase